MLLLALLPAGCQFIRIEEGERTAGGNSGRDFRTDGTEEKESISDDLSGGRYKVSDEGIWRAAYRRVQYSGGGGFRIRERSILQDKADRSGESGCRQ